MIWEIWCWSELYVFKIEWIVFVTDWFKEMSRCDTGVRPSKIKDLITYVASYIKLGLSMLRLVIDQLL